MSSQYVQNIAEVLICFISSNSCILKSIQLQLAKLDAGSSMSVMLFNYVTIIYFITHAKDDM